ncbi:MAG: hypothetical protein C4308_07420 [Chitinophagaceae bacterium]
MQEKVIEQPQGVTNQAASQIAKAEDANDKKIVKPSVVNTRADSVFVTAKNQSGKKKAAQQQTNYFRGQVVDANNNPLPFANVTNTNDNVGTYADAQGYFILISPDSVLDVQVRSVGFENNRVQLRNNVPANGVILQEDENKPDSILSDRVFNTNRARDSHVKIEEPEPQDGWYNYDTYLINNIILPKEVKNKRRTGQVELSFEVDEYGNPVNIRIEKSLCSDCDKEAIRLIQQGPKWKSKGVNSRVTVTVPFRL